MTRESKHALKAARTQARSKLLCLVVFVVVVLHARTPIALGMCTAVACAAAFVARLRAHDAIAVLRPLAPIVLITAIMQVLYIQQGDVLAQIGPIAITVGALCESARMVVGLVCIMVASVAFMRTTTTEELVFTLRWLIGPLRKLGVRTDAVMLALSVAFRFVPVLAADFLQLKRAQESRMSRFEGGVRERLTAYTRLFAPLVRGSFRRADTLAEAFLARCFGCTGSPTTLHEHHLATCDFALIGATALLAAVMFL